MALQRRPSGIWVEVRGAATVTPQGPALRRARLGELKPPAPAGAGRRRAAAAQAPLSEEEAVVNALEAQDLELLDAIPIAPAAAPAAARRGPARAGAASAAAAEIELAVPIAGNESAVVLLEQDGVYEWQWAGEERAPTEQPPPALASPRRRRRSAAAAPQRSLVFRIPLAPAAPAAAAPRAARRGLLRRLAGTHAVAYVFRFLLPPVLGGIARYLEGKVAEGLVRIAAPEPESWHYVEDGGTLALPAGRPARVLLLVHGTFSSTVGSFGALAGQPDGRAFLEAALRRYDLVLGYDHPTLSVLPSENAGALARRLEAIPFAVPPEVDAVSFSRGGLVLRSLVEQVLPGAQLDLQLRRAIFVACTNGGTELANAANWHRFADRYTNLAAAGARAAALVPGFTSAGIILASAIRGVGVLVKVLATSALTDGAIPGLAAMQPDGDFVREINRAQPGQPTPEQAFYCAITSDFDPDQPGDDPEAMPPGLLLKLADKATDALYGKPNDLVVHVESMTQIDPSVGAYIREVFRYGVNGRVHHCNYFSQPETAQRLLHWLQLVPGTATVVEAGVPARAPASAVVKLPSTMPADAALAQVRAAGKPWIVVERPWHEDGRELTLRYAHPTELGEAWLADAARSGATVHEAFNLHETDRSREAPVGTAPELAAAPGPALHSTFGSHFRTIEMADGEPVGVLSPPEAVPRMAGAEAPPAPRRRASRGPRAAPPDLPMAAPSAPVPRAKPPAAAVECQFRAETDDEYVLGQVHTTVVTISREQLAAAARKASATAVAKVKAAKPLVVECMPMLRVVLADPDDARVEVPVPAAGAPTTLHFDLQGSEAGPAQVKVQVRQGPLPLVMLTLDFQVVAQRSGLPRPVTAQAGLASFPARLPLATDELRIIQVQPAGQKTQYRYELRLPSQRVQQAFESPLLDSEPGAYVASIHKRIEDRWADSGREKEAFARDLRAIGAELFDELFPLELKQQLWAHRQAIRSVQVLSSEPFIPWELVLVSDPAQRRAGPDAAYLGELGVVRWLVDGYPPEELRLRAGKARYVVPSYPPPDELPAAQEEIGMMKKDFGATAVKAEGAAVYDLLASPGQFDLLHIACHGEANAADIGSAKLVMPGRPRQDGSLSEEHVLATTVRREADLRDGEAQPIVVLNACQSARAGYTLKGVGGFAEAFIAAGAGVFVGSSWSVGDPPALAFVQEFYRQFVERGQPLAAAAAAGRKQARADGDATWLAYVVYGHPRARVKKG